MIGIKDKKKVFKSRQSCYPVEIVNSPLLLLPYAVTAKIDAEAEMDKKRLVILCGLMLMLAGRLAAKDLIIGINYNGYYSDNIFMNASGITDYVSQLNADINFTTEKFNFYLDAGGGIYKENPEFNTFNLEPGVEFLHNLKGRNAIQVILGYTVLNYKELFSDFNYSGPKFQANLKIYTAGQFILKGGYDFESRNYPNYDSFDFLNHKAFLEISRFLKSQTTVRLQAGFNYRYYPHIVQNLDFGDDYNYFDNKKSQGQWKHKGQGPHSPSDPPDPSGPDELIYDGMGIPNVYGLLRIVQGIGARVGITGEAELRKNFRGLDDADALIKNSYIIYPFNDDYLWDGLRFSLTIKIVLSNAFAVEGLVSYADKNYPGVYVMDAEGNVVEPVVEREDSLLRCTLKLSKKIGKLDLSAGIFYRNNTSTDDYFLYKMLTISAGIGYYFQGLK